MDQESAEYRKDTAVEEGGTRNAFSSRTTKNCPTITTFIQSHMEHESVVDRQSEREMNVVEAELLDSDAAR